MADVDNIDQSSPPRRRFKRRYVAALLVMLALLVGAWGYVKYQGSFTGALAPFLPSPNLAQVFGKPNLRIIVMGLDENWTEKDLSYTAGARTDTLLGVNVDLNSKQVSVLSIPRDLWVYIPKSGYAKVNEAYGDGGPQRVESTIVNDFKTPPFDYYIVLKIDATKNIVNALGGLDVNVEKDMDYDDSWGHLHIHLKKGLHRLEGEQVVGYVRFRHDPEGDFGRMRRQRQVIAILAKRLRDPNVALHLPALLGVFKDNVRTDMPFGKMFDLALGMRGVTPQMVHSAQLPATVGWIEGESVLFYPDVEAHAVARKYLTLGFSNVFDPSTVHVRVENGSGTPGAASAFADFLRQRGFTIVETRNAKDFTNSKTTIRTTNQEIAGEIAKQLPVKSPQIAVGPIDDVDVVIVVGRDYRIP